MRRHVKKSVRRIAAAIILAILMAVFTIPFWVQHASATVGVVHPYHGVWSYLNTAAADQFWGQLWLIYAAFVIPLITIAAIAAGIVQIIEKR